MAAKVTAKLALDASGFTAALTRAQASLGKLGLVGFTAMTAGFAAATAAAGAMAIGIKKAIDAGGALSELSARTGVAAGDLSILQMAFERAGVGAEKVGPSINKMQKAIVEAGQGGKEAQQGFEMLGLSVADISRLSPDKQFEAISKAIGGIDDPAQQAAAAMKIFGRSGGEMLALFKDSGALGDAAVAVGGQAELLSRNANLFDRASDVLNTSGAKLEGFFVGMADQVVPAFIQSLEKFNSVDLSGLGQQFGYAASVFIQAITDGNIWRVMGLSAQIQLRNAANEFGKTMQGVAAAFPSLFDTTLKNLQLVGRPEFWAGAKAALLSAAISFGQKLAYVVADALAGLSEIPGLRNLVSPALDAAISAGDSFAGKANEANASASANFETIFAQLNANIEEGYSIAGQAFLNGVSRATDVFDNGELQKSLDEAVFMLGDTLDKNVQAARDKFSATKTQTPLLDGLEDQAGKGNTGIIAQSLQKVGGGAAFARFSDAANPAAEAVREQKKSNNYLQTIAEGINYIRNGNGSLMPA